MPGEWRYFDVGDFLVIAEAVIGIPADVLGRSERVVSQADSALHVPPSGFGTVEAYPGLAEKVGVPLRPDHAQEGCALVPVGKRVVLLEFIERNGGELHLRAGDTAESVTDVMVHLAAHNISERESIDWVDGRIQP